MPIIACWFLQKCDKNHHVDIYTMARLHVGYHSLVAHLEVRVTIICVRDVTCNCVLLPITSSKAKVAYRGQISQYSCPGRNFSLIQHSVSHLIQDTCITLCGYTLLGCLSLQTSKVSLVKSGDLSNLSL